MMLKRDFPNNSIPEQALQWRFWYFDRDGSGDLSWWECYFQIKVSFGTYCGSRGVLVNYLGGRLATLALPTDLPCY